MTNARMAPMHCPYCGDEDLRPVAEPASAWECRSCARVFTLSFVGLSAERLGGAG